MSATVQHFQHDVAEKLCDQVLSHLRLRETGAVTKRAKSCCSVRISKKSKVCAYIRHQAACVRIELFVPPKGGDQAWLQVAERFGIKLVTRLPSERWGQKTRLHAVIEEGQVGGAVELLRESAEYRASV
jgi:hypothetical protein